MGQIDRVVQISTFSTSAPKLEIRFLIIKKSNN